MRKGGGIIAVVAGSIGVIAAFMTLLFGGIGSALEAEGANTVIGLGWGGVASSFVVIGLGAAVIAARSKMPAVFLAIVAVLGAIVGGTLVAIFMALALVGAVLALLAPRPLVHRQGDMAGYQNPRLPVAITLAMPGNGHIAWRSNLTLSG